MFPHRGRKYNPIFFGLNAAGVQAELLHDGYIEIEFADRNGDEAVFKTKRDTSSTVCC
jgi:hypothetical protein